MSGERHSNVIELKVYALLDLATATSNRMSGFKEESIMIPGPLDELANGKGIKIHYHKNQIRIVNHGRNPWMVLFLHAILQMHYTQLYNIIFSSSLSV